ncbi:hypothetical protein P029_04860 [Anaplasma phagocytophilum str. Norway variant2]|uniref:Msp4/OMP-like domain-containing protein n=1 Tax=Anaplasma phagocytophilum str. Norway variant2 TaxID=1392507 RepID=A0A161I6G0_ANAPH|nr:hypothetical protein P029_04860 [Anaplasma phagocytophilum str. Norway variant2]
MEISHPGIDKKVCETKSVAGTSGAGNSFGKYAGKTTAKNEKGNNGTSLCGGHGSTHSSAGNGSLSAETLKDFASATLGVTGANWPQSTAAVDAEQQPKPNDNAKAVAKDLTKLTAEEKTIVAGLLAKTIEGGEVVEIRAVSSTSVMVNACYDLLSEGLGVVPYACVGLGGNFVGVVDGHITPKLAYRLKAGLSYQLSPEISAFAGGFYHRVVGDGVYDDLPAQLP